MAMPYFVSAQKHVCETHSRTNAILNSSPEKRALAEQLHREALEYTENHYGQRAGAVKVIPTVFHVIHNDGAENISKDAILDILDYVNEELRGENNTNAVISEFSNLIADTEFELRLAKIDVNGNCTDGITRTKSAQTYQGGEGVKSLVNWNTGSRRYLQVWLVQSLTNGAGGYTYLPGSTGAQSNGIIIRTGQLQQSLSHEFGHWMNLSHTWGPTNSPEDQSNCSFDDGVSDTPNTVGTSGTCNLNQQSCGSLDNVQNHMDYSTCSRMFTLGQAARMQAAANSSIGGRSTYWSGANRQATGTNDGFDSSCVPTIAFFPQTSRGCEGTTIQFQDQSFGADQDPSWSWLWEFEGGTPATSTEVNPSVTYNQAGTFNVKLTITNDAGTDSELKQEAITITATGTGAIGPLTEGVEDENFPAVTGTDTDWTVSASSSAYNWQRTTQAAATGNASVRVNLRSAQAGSVFELISPPINMSNVSTSDARLYFKLAHSNRSTTTHTERLRVYVSDDCGETWKLRYNKAGNALNTAGGLNSGTYTPSASHWKEEVVSLGVVAGKDHVLVKFEATSDNQSNLYIDDININPNASSVGIAENNLVGDITIFPNPITEASQVRISTTQAAQAEISVVNMIGQTLVSTVQALQSGSNTVALSDKTYQLNAGVYMLKVTTPKGTQSMRFVKQ